MKVTRARLEEKMRFSVPLTSPLPELQNDYLSRLLREAAKDEGPLKKETIVGNKMIGLLIASHETTSSAITFVISYLAECPNQCFENRTGPAVGPGQTVNRVYQRSGSDNL